MNLTTGKRELAAIDGARGEATEARIRRTSPLLADMLLDHAFGTVFASTALSRREREMATIGMLGAIGGVEPQLRLHVEAALRVGADRDEIVALLEQMSVYAGYPRAINMLNTVREVFDEERLPMAAGTKEWSLRDSTTRVFDSGENKPVLVLVHALGLDWRMWRDVIPHLTRAHRVIAYDLRGFGAAQTAAPAQGLSDYAVDLAELIQSLGTGPVHLAGLSLGGSIGLELALKHPELLSSLTVIAATAWSFPAFAERAHAADEQGLPAQIAPSLTRWFRPSDLATNNWGVRYARDCVERADLAGWRAGWNALAGIGVGEHLGQICIPTHVIAGENDASTPPSLMQGLAEIPTTRFTTISGAPHMLALTHADELAKAISLD
ncbi:alpha/beta fold hydrolase [Altererythrobacter sp. Root672]|uniref:alpha/beta fold hydrolase n=1 Tax=Altererythrobacter sp. Root672 TaxID=1736584 RepID=UPI0007006007|nr:alpha/beta fold hydrolase [Altererythrobacter sp. Root672]KRA83690.1 carboxymuconolactone decarboxylase [Altererythrobacter sp. Root672]